MSGPSRPVRILREVMGEGTHSTLLAAVEGNSSGLNNQFAGRTGMVQDMVQGSLAVSGHPTRLEIHRDRVRLGVLPQMQTLTSALNVFVGGTGAKPAQPVVVKFRFDEILDLAEIDGERERTMAEWRMASRGPMGALIDGANDYSAHHLLLSTAEGDCRIRVDSLADRRKVVMALIDLLEPDEEHSPARLPPPSVGRWLADPTGRYELRYHSDGWTEHVSREGSSELDHEGMKLLNPD